MSFLSLPNIFFKNRDINPVLFEIVSTYSIKPTSKKYVPN